MSVVAVNPMAYPYGQAPKPQKTFFQRHSSKFKALLAIGVVACVGAVGFVAGSNSKSSVEESVTSAGNSGSNVEGNSEASPITLARSTIKSAFNDEDNVAVTGKLTIEHIEQLLQEYRQNPDAWEDQYLSKDLMEAFSTLRKEAESEITSRRLREDGSRDLIGSYDSNLVNTAWEMIEGASYSSSNTVKNGDDKVQVTRQGSNCYIVSEESNSAGDWFRNLDVGSEDILSIKNYNVQAESCGCEKETLWWCSTYKTCSTSKKIGVGYDGFVKTYNTMRFGVQNLVNSVCKSSDTLHFFGYSRGGAIVSILAYAYLQDGLWNKSKMKLVTFGSPRALDDDSSDRLHLKFTQFRMVFENDMVPSIPYDWWGFKHFGNLRCKDCGYAEERDRPLYSWSIPDHLSYCKFFGDAKC